MTDQLAYSVHSAERTVTPAFTLNQIGGWAYEQAVDSERYPRMNLSTAQLMCALTLEAVLNHVGQCLICDDAGESALWDAVERLSPKQKLLVIAERLRVGIDFGILPFQDFKAIFDFRNDLAHAKSMHLSTSDIPGEAVSSDHYLDVEKVPGLLADWEKQVSQPNAKRWRESVRAMSVTLCEAADCMNPLIVGEPSSWGGSWSPVDGA